MKRYLLPVFALLSCQIVLGQNVAINNDGSLPNASAILDIKSTTKGLLMPRMTTVQRNAIITPAEGLKVFDTDTKSFWYHNGIGWIELATGSPTNFWTLNGADISNNNTGNVGIGTNTPVSKLTVQTGFNSAGYTHIGDDGVSGIIVTEAIGGVSASIGTTTNHAFRLQSNNAGRLSVYPNGKVVVGSNAFSPANLGRLTIESELNGYGFNHSDGVVSIGTFIGSSPVGGWLGTISNHPLYFFTNNGGAAITVLQNNNVGIATTLPSDKLHVTGSFRLTGPQKIDATNTLEFGFGVTGKEANAGKIGYQTFTPGALDIIGAGTVSGNRKIKFWNEGGAEFGGAVGIGTNNTAGYQLAVNGSIRSKEVVVEAAWADYVFEKNYRLPPLEEVEKFIHQNKHLPNIPSAKEIEEKGLQIGDVQKRMMEKIEELTLYIIEANKQTEGLKKEIEILKAQLKK